MYEDGTSAATIARELGRVGLTVRLGLCREAVQYERIRCSYTCADTQNIVEASNDHCTVRATLDTDECRFLAELLTPIVLLT